MKKDNLLFTILFAIYIAAGVIAIILFYTRGSYLSRELAASATVQIEADTVETDTVEPDTIEPDTIEPDTVDTDQTTPDIPEEPQTPAEPEVPDVPETPEVPETPAEPETPEVPEEPAEPEASTEPTDEAADDADSEDDGKTYYGFTVIDGVKGVRIRETSARNSKTVSHIDGGKSGYVLEKGDTRSKILTKKGTIGYIYNEYLTITEIPKKDFPEEYR